MGWHAVSGSPDYTRFSLFFKLKITSDFRARREEQIPLNESSGNLNLTDFVNFFILFTSKKYENPYFSFYLLKNRPWNHVKSLDLAICYKFHQSRAPETQI